MKTKSFFRSVLVVLLLGTGMSASAYTKDPTLCNGVSASWDATARKFTVTGLHGSIQEPWICYLTDASWCSTCYVDICPYGTYTPGATTFLSSRLGTAYGDPLVNGANGSSAAFIAIKSTTNDLPKGAKSEDCNVTCDGTCLAKKCNGVSPLYCDKYDAKFSGSIINVTGIMNCSNDNMFMIATSDFSKWQSVAIKVDPSNADKGSADVSALQYYQTTENVYPYASGVMFFMNSDDKGGGPSGRGPNYCSVSFEAGVTSSVKEVSATETSIYPSPAAVGQTVTVGGTFAQDSKVYIYDATGKLVASVVPSIVADGLSFAVPAQVSVINFVKIISNGASFSAKLQVIK
jgi:hypothetical protein